MLMRQTEKCFGAFMTGIAVIACMQLSHENGPKMYETKFEPWGLFTVLRVQQDFHDAVKFITFNPI